MLKISDEVLVRRMNCYDSLMKRYGKAGITADERKELIHVIFKGTMVEYYELKHKLDEKYLG